MKLYDKIIDLIVDRGSVYKTDLQSVKNCKKLCDETDVSYLYRMKESLKGIPETKDICITIEYILRILVKPTGKMGIEEYKETLKWYQNKYKAVSPIIVHTVLNVTINTITGEDNIFAKRDNIYDALIYGAGLIFNETHHDISTCVRDLCKVFDLNLEV